MKTLYSDQIADMATAQEVAQKMANREHQNIAIYRNQNGLYLVRASWDVLPASYRIKVVKPQA